MIVSELAICRVIRSVGDNNAKKMVEIYAMQCCCPQRLSLDRFRHVYRLQDVKLCRRQGWVLFVADPETDDCSVLPPPASQTDEHANLPVCGCIFVSLTAPTKDSVKSVQHALSLSREERL